MKKSIKVLLTILALTVSSQSFAYFVCPGEVSSPKTGAPTSVYFQNNSSTTVFIYWMNFQGQRVYYYTLQPGQGYSQQTYYRHVWVVSNQAGDCLQTATAGAGFSNVVIN